MVRVRVNGKAFNTFKQIDISRSMDALSGECRIIVTEQKDRNSFLIMGDLVEVFFDDVQVMAGWIEKISDSESSSSHDISYMLRDKVGDIIDSAIPDNLKANTIEGIKKYSDLCQLVVDGLELKDEIKVIDEVGKTINANEIKAVEVGGNSYEFLNEYARKVQVFLNTDGQGNLLIRNQYPKLKTILASVTGFTKNNIKSSSLSLDDSQRFYKYLIRSNGSLSSTGKTISKINYFGSCYNDPIRKSRLFEKISESPMSPEQCTAAAAEECNIRRIRGFDYKCTVSGFSANGELWNIGKLVQVKDSKKGVIGEFLIKEIKWTSAGNGEITELSLTYPDAYQATEEISALTERKTKAATTYTVVKGDNLTFISQRFGVKLGDLIKANPQIQNPNLIEPNDRINIPVEDV